MTIAKLPLVLRHRAIANALEQRPGLTELSIYQKTLEEAFIWGDTIEGHAYWSKAHKELYLADKKAKREMAF
jgi:hypothetical protein